MKHKKSYTLSMGMLLIQVHAPLVVYGTEVRLVERLILLVYMSLPGTPGPAPEVEVKPIFQKEISQSPSEVRKSEHNKLPQTNES